jgi:YesN/AraC family two-component response regulator
MGPGINGLKIYERILENNPIQKAIIASGFAKTKDVKKAQQLGAGKYIWKPFALETLGIVVKEEHGKIIVMRKILQLNISGGTLKNSFIRGMIF